MANSNLYYWLEDHPHLYDIMMKYDIDDQRFLDLVPTDFANMNVAVGDRIKLTNIIRMARASLADEYDADNYSDPSPAKPMPHHSQPSAAAQQRQYSQANQQSRLGVPTAQQLQQQPLSQQRRMPPLSQPNLQQPYTGVGRQQLGNQQSNITTQSSQQQHAQYQSRLNTQSHATYNAVPAPANQFDVNEADSYAVEQTEEYEIAADDNAEAEPEDDDDLDDYGAIDSKGQLPIDGWVTHSRIRVAVRKRPINVREKGRGELDIAVTGDQSPAIVIHEPKQKVDLTKFVECHEFVFDEVFGEHSTNEQIYQQCCKPLIAFFLNKGKATCFAYGQTGSGKTFTMMGPGTGAKDQAGLYVLAARDIFQLIQRVPAYQDFEVYVSFFEIYGGKLFDLLNNRAKLVAREDASKNVQVVGLCEKLCTNVDDLLALMADGNKTRSTGSTGANEDSSRSHAVLQIVVKKTVKVANAKPKLKVQGKFSFIDLAGSERAADTTNNNQQTRLEGAEINKSLLALKECIRALDMESKHLPFRGSQLTQVLKDSFVGNSRTVMLANVSPNSGSCEHTLNTLRYANRVKELKKSENGKVQGGAKGANSYNAYMPHQQQKAPAKRYQGDVDTELGPGGYDDNPASPLDEQKNIIQAPNVLHKAKLASVARVPPQQQVHQHGESYEDDSDFVRTHQLQLQDELLHDMNDIIQAHRSEIDSAMKLVRQEMETLKQYDLNDCSLNDYIIRVDGILERRVQNIMTFRSKLHAFQQHLAQEEALSQQHQTNHLFK